MKNILVLCTGNSARSILGEALLEKLGEGRIKAFSAGSAPKGNVHPASIKLLNSKDFDTCHFRSKSWDEFSLADATQLDIVITVCDSAGSETCPIWTSKNDKQPVKTHWGIPDPAAIEGAAQDEAFELAYNQMLERVIKLVALSFEELDESKLKTALDHIGRDSDGATLQTMSGNIC